ncbi:cation:proton antiporter [Rhizohabitans arisaemae]|uniref:cation:proton antiporter domain-containing protein n=1 Tax=Rhizohabitans arisaemae TaxID=2720610 RepID=UPI0024B21338|nr:cation:proton antiporter [Rhizohabitans arisaemae]
MESKTSFLPRRWRIGAVYSMLVVFPSILAVVILGGGSGGAGGESPGADAGSGPAGITRLLVAIALIVGVCKIAGKLAQRIGQPAVVGEITAGILLGPSVLGLAFPAASAWLFPDAVLGKLNVLAQLGAVLFVFLAGTELNIRMLRGSGPLAVMVSHVGIALPLFSGILLAVTAYPVFAPPGVSFAPFALFVGVAMSISALPVMARMLSDAGLQNTKIAGVALSSALVDDITAWCLLAVVVTMLGTGSLSGVLLTLVLAVGFVAVLMLVVRPVLQRVLHQPWMRKGTSAATLTLVLVFLSAMATDSLGIHAIFGAFLFGLTIPRDSPVVEELRSVIGGLTTVLLLPIFFAITGVNTKLHALGLSFEMWGWFLAFLVVAFAGKLGGSMLAARSVGESWDQATRIGLLMNCRGLTELVVLNVGLSLGVLTGELFAIMVVIALLSTAMAAPAVRFRSRGKTDGSADAAVPEQGLPDAPHTEARPDPDLVRV